MSQEKVDKYKEAKKTRKQDMQKLKKRNQLITVITRAVLVLIVAALLFGIGVTIKNQIAANQKTDPYAETGFDLNDYANIQGTAESESESAE